MSTPRFDLISHLYRQRKFSETTFGPGVRTAGVIDHIRKELLEIESNPEDVVEWVDVILLAFDGAWRTGALPEEITAAIASKQEKNESRTWPDWRTADQTKAIEHVRPASIGNPIVETGARWTQDMLDRIEAHVTELRGNFKAPKVEDEPFGYFRALSSGWEDCAETAEGAVALYERPDPRELAGRVLDLERKNAELTAVVQKLSQPESTAPNPEVKRYKIADTMPRGILSGATGCNGCCFFHEDELVSCKRPAEVESCTAAAAREGVNVMMAGYIDTEKQTSANHCAASPEAISTFEHDLIVSQKPEQCASVFPERDQNKPAEQQGIFRKFIVQRVDGSDAPGGKHHGCRYFVLDLDHDAHAPAAMLAYSADCANTHPQLSREIRAEFGRCQTCNGHGMVGGHVGQTAESFDYVSEPCPDCQPISAAFARGLIVDEPELTAAAQKPEGGNK